MGWMQSLSQAEWERASVYEVASTSSLARIEDDKDAELAGEYGGWFSKSIEKLKDASVVSTIVFSSLTLT